jgi:hypothetical protein
MKLYNEDGEQIGLKEVVDWFNEIYPADIFIKHPIAAIRDTLNKFWKENGNEREN